MANIKRRRTRQGQWRYDVEYRTPDGSKRTKTFRALRDAQRHSVSVEADKLRGGWIDPRGGRITFEDYSAHWLAARQLRPTTRELYDSLLRTHLLPRFGTVLMDRITTASVRAWQAERLTVTSAVTAAKAYRLLRTILNTAVEDELLVKNPCTIKGAGVEHSRERPVANVAQVYALAEAVEPRYRALILVATFVGLRFGEIAALRRRSIDLLHGKVHVTEQLQQLRGGRFYAGAPKTAAGVRSVALPPFVVSEVAEHLAQYADPEPDALVFTTEEGAPLDRSRWRHKFRAAAVRVPGLPAGFHFHDLRGTGNTLAAATGVSTKELMRRLGHASPRAALLYQHATDSRDETIAQRLHELVHGTLVAPATVTALLRRPEGTTKP